MASSRQFQILLPLLGLGLVAVAVFLKRKKVRDCDVDYFVEEHSSTNTEHPITRKDYITRLPDDILRHIITYLGMKDTVRISVLSRRWRKLYCTLQPNPKFEFHKMFEFVTPNAHNNCYSKNGFVTAVQKMSEFVSLTKHNYHCEYKQRFVNAVDTYLCLRSDFPMESFTLRFCLMREFSGHLRRWLNYIVRCDVRKLDIDFGSSNKLLKIRDSELVVFPFKVLLSAYMLEYVELSFCIVEPNFQGSFNSLNSLKELRLYMVSLVNGEVESISLSCPQLRLLDVRHCKLPCKLIVNAHELRTLTIRFCKQVNEIGLSAPNLDVIEYYGNCALSLLPSYVPNLRRFYLDLMGHKGPPHGFGGFVGGAHWLHCLWIQALPYQVQYIQTEMPELRNLHTLSLHVINDSLDLRDIISMIAVCPNISRFELSTPLCSLSYREMDTGPPLCVHLKSVSLDGFKFDPAQKKFASQLVRCAPALEIMRLYPAYSKYSIGKNVERNLPFKKRVFSDALMIRTQQELQDEALSSSTSVIFCEEVPEFMYE